MALPAWGAAGLSSGGGSGTTCNCPVPSGVAANHIVTVPLYVEVAQAVTPPSGFAEAPDSPVIITGSQAHYLHVFWKRATGSDSGNYTFTIASGLAWRLGIAARFTGCVTTGNPWDVTVSASKNTTTDAVTPIVSDFTGGPERLWVWTASYYNGNQSMTPPSGFSERIDVMGGVALTLATKDQPVAGASGNVQGTWSGNGATAAWMGALLPANPSSPKFLPMF